MTPEFASAATVSSVGVALASLVCRIGYMQHGETRPLVFVQHLCLASGLVIALIVPLQYALMPAAVGVQLFLGLGAARWRHGAPRDTRKASDGPPSQA